MELKEVNLDDLPEMSAEQLEDLARADQEYELLRSFHTNVHHDWDDMTFAAWLDKLSDVDLIVLDDYLKYTRAYVGHALIARGVRSEQAKGN